MWMNPICFSRSGKPEQLEETYKGMGKTCTQKGSTAYPANYKGENNVKKIYNTKRIYIETVYEATGGDKIHKLVIHKAVLKKWAQFITVCHMLYFIRAVPNKTIELLS